MSKTGFRSLILPASIVLVALVSGACTQPVLRSMRIEPGFELVGAAEVLVGGREATSKSAGDAEEPTRDEGAVAFWPFNADARYGFVNDAGIGLAGGLYAFGVHNQKINGSGSGCLPPLWMLVPYVQAGVTRGRVAASVGAEGGCGAWALFAGLDFRLFEHEHWPVSVSPAGRWTVPWGPDADTPANQVPRDESYEVGGSLRVGYVFAQYWHEWNRGPTRLFEHPGGNLRAKTWHTFSLGFIIPFSRL